MFWFSLKPSFKLKKNKEEKKGIVIERDENNENSGGFALYSMEGIKLIFSKRLEPLQDFELNFDNMLELYNPQIPMQFQAIVETHKPGKKHRWLSGAIYEVVGGSELLLANGCTLSFGIKAEVKEWRIPFYPAMPLELGIGKRN